MVCSGGFESPTHAFHSAPLYHLSYKHIGDLCETRTRFIRWTGVGNTHIRISHTGADSRNRTYDLFHTKEMLCQTELYQHIGAHGWNRTSDAYLFRVALYRLSYACILLVGAVGIEPTNAWLKARCLMPIGLTPISCLAAV